MGSRLGSGFACQRIRNPLCPRKPLQVKGVRMGCVRASREGAGRASVMVEAGACVRVTRDQT